MKSTLKNGCRHAGRRKNDVLEWIVCAANRKKKLFHFKTEIEEQNEIPLVSRCALVARKILKSLTGVRRETLCTTL